MTSVQFVGDLPLWLGLLLATIVGALSWIYYRRESFDLSRAQRILLPFLRSLAFFLGVLILTAPVLKHRQTIGELGKVRVFVDFSQSMAQHDKQMNPRRKLEIARRLGWLVGGPDKLSTTSPIDEITRQRKILNAAVTDESADPKRVQELATGLVAKLNSVTEPIDEKQAAVSLARELEQLISANMGDELPKYLTKCQEWERSVQSKLEESLASQIGSKDSLTTAIKLFDDSPRWRRIELALQGKSATSNTADFLRELRQRHDVELFVINHVDRNPIKVNLDEPINLESLVETPGFGESTDLSDSIATQINAAIESGNEDNTTSPSKTAIVLISDGRHNRGTSPIQMARLFGPQGFQFFNVAVGSMLAAKDLAVIKVDYPQLVFKKDEVQGQIIIRDSMTAGTPFVAQVRSGDLVLWQQEMLAQNIGERKVDFAFDLNKWFESQQGSTVNENPGSVQTHIQQLALEATITPLAEETDPENNRQPIRLSVSTQGYRILILDGRSRWETRFIRNAFERDGQWEVNSIIAGSTTSTPNLPRGDGIGKFPTSKSKLFEYDLIIWGEFEPELMDEQEFNWVREFVENRGGGLVFIDGLRGKVRRLETTPIADLLPVLKTLPMLKRVVDHLEVAPGNDQLPALSLVPGERRNLDFWKKIPPPKVIIPIEPTADSKSLVDAMVEGKRFPAIVQKNVGAGRVLYLAFDETWRWRYKSADKWHQKIWQQLAKYTMPIPFTVSDEFVSLDTGQASYEAGEKPKLRVKLNAVDGNPNTESVVEAVVWENGKVVSTTTLSHDQTVPGLYRGELNSLPAGDYEVTIRASGYQESALKAKSRILIRGSESGEMIDTSANYELLAQMADETGGAILLEENFGDLPERLEPLSNGRIIETETVLWQSYWWFGVMVLLLATEWILRKRAGLL